MADPDTPRWRLSISQGLALGFGLMLLLAGIPFATAMLSGRINTMDLLRDRNQRVIERVVSRIRMQLDPVRDHVEGLRRRIEQGALDMEDADRLGLYLQGILDGVPQMDAVGVVRAADLQSLRAVREGGRVIVVSDNMQDYPGTRRRMDEARRNAESLPQEGPANHNVIWGDLIWEPTLRQSLINIRAPIVRDGKFVAAAAGIVASSTLSRVLAADGETDRAANFILIDELNVLAHPTIRQQDYHLSVEKPLPILEEIDDPVLRQIWRGRTDVAITRSIIRGEEAHVVSAEGQLWMFVYQKLDHYGDRSWLVGRYFPLTEIEDEVNRLRLAAAVGFAGMILTVFIAWRFGRSIGQPVRALADAANRLKALDFEAHPMPRLRLRELDDASQAFNAATAALSWFSNYVPRKLVSRLLREGEEAVNVSREREVTVMFTDIVGFTALSETLSAPDTAALLNEHFALIAHCIEAEGGVIDKFIGDGVMALWGAIKRDQDQAAAACRAALAIARAVSRDNAGRRQRGETALRLRCGLHTGPTVVGNIGAPGRINYTVVGDTVNIAQRLEQLGREHMTAEDEVVVLASAATVALADLPNSPALIGHIQIKGRSAPIEVYRLTLP